MKVVEISVAQMTKTSGFRISNLSRKITEENIEVSPELKNAMANCDPDFESIPQGNVVMQAISDLQLCASADKLEELCHYLFLHESFPAWYPNTANNSIVELRIEIIEHFPLVFLNVLKYYGIPGSTLVTICDHMDLKTLIKSIHQINPERTDHLANLQKLGSALSQLNNPVIGTLRRELFRLTLSAWKTNNWNRLSSIAIWKEWSWALYTGKGIEKRKFLSLIQGIRSHLPRWSPGISGHLCQCLGKAVVFFGTNSNSKSKKKARYFKNGYRG